MKRYLLPIIMLMLTCIISPSIKAEDCGLSIDHSILLQISEGFKKDNINEKDACMLIVRITMQVIEAQNYISRIADNTVDYDDKIRSGGLIDTTIDRHYTNEDALIQVTSIRSNAPKDYYIKAYLQHLADLSYKGIYNQAKLVFYQNQMRLLPETINENEEDTNTYKLAFEVFQDFIGCKTVDGEQCYKDVTKNNFWITVSDIKSPKRQIKINAISAIQTYDFDSYHEQNTLTPTQ